MLAREVGREDGVEVDREVPAKLRPGEHPPEVVELLFDGVADDALGVPLVDVAEHEVVGDAEEGPVDAPEPDEVPELGLGDADGLGGPLLSLELDQEVGDAGFERGRGRAALGRIDGLSLPLVAE